jgi:hypothetical protein
MTDSIEPLHLTDFSQCTIDLNRPFIKQQFIQTALEAARAQAGQPISDLVLYVFLEIIKRATQQELDFLQELKGLKFGYERAVKTNLGNRIESRFIADENWRPEYDLEILNKKKISFLSSTLEESHEEGGSNPDALPESDRPIDLLGNKVTHELLHLDPTLQDCEEFHVYIFRRISRTIIRPRSRMRMVADDDDMSFARSGNTIDIQTASICPQCGPQDVKRGQIDPNGPCDQSCPARRPNVLNNEHL